MVRKILAKIQPIYNQTAIVNILNNKAKTSIKKII